MKAVVADPIGGPENLCYVNLPVPQPGPGEVLVKIEAVGVNFIDTYFRTGLYKAPESPVRLGSEAAGVVEGTGQRVAYAMARGSYAEYAAVPSQMLVPLPDDVSFEDGAAVMLQGMTAHYLTRSTFPLQKGQTCLVHAAAGGAGLLLVQLAKIAGATVIGTVSTEEKASLVREHGADHVILYTQQDFVAEIKSITSGKGVDVVYDSVGKTTFHKSLDCLRPRGVMVTFGQSSGAVGEIDPLLLSQKGSLFLTRPSLGNYTSDPAELRWRAKDLFGWLETGQVRLQIHKTYKLEQAAEGAPGLGKPQDDRKAAAETVNIAELESRRQLVSPLVRAARAHAFLTSALPNVRYLTGFTGSNGALLLTAERALLFTDPRYQTQAPLETDCNVKIVKGPLLGEIAKWLKRLGVKALGFERNRISFEEYAQLKELAKGVALKPLTGVVETLRMVKSDAEMATIRASVKLNSAALELALEHFKTDMTEVDLAAEINYRMRLLGADGTSFDTIVASGPRTALPHAHPTDHPITADELLLIDMGASVSGYASDMTRTYAVGKLDARRKRIYKAVLESQRAAIDAIKPGVSCAAVDRAARRVLTGHGMDKLFIHSTGHGLGLEIHERPRIGRKDLTKLEAGMAITIEPGVYQEGIGGVRIEDTVAVTAKGCEVLTPSGKELVVL